MPAYDYICNNCHAVREIVHGMTQKKRPKCPKCGKVMKKTISGGAGIIFKGDGFYETTYKERTGFPSKKGEARW